MQFGSTSIAVPFTELGGDPTSFAPDWRAQVAEVLSSGYDEKKVPKQLKDRYVLEHAKFLSAFKSKGDVDAVYDKYRRNGLVMNWAAENNNSKTKHYLQALLLTDQPIDVVAADLQLDEKVVKLYCDLYFACRSEVDKYEMVLPMETRLSFAFGEISHDAKQLPTYVSWRVIAVRNGYTALVRNWGTESVAHGKLDEGYTVLDRNMSLAGANMEQQLRANTVGFKSLVEYMNSWQGYRKMQDNADGVDGMSSQAYVTLGRIFEAIAPKLASDRETEQAKKAEVKAGKKKLLAEKNIERHNSDDDNAKAAAAEFNKLKREKFKLIDSTTGSKQ